MNDVDCPDQTPGLCDIESGACLVRGKLQKTYESMRLSYQWRASEYATSGCHRTAAREQEPAAHAGTGTD
ncbi:hypothetical protein [Chitinasiproducens palmae]|uniref:hypothetical protein n=1 Tax=Chitinasiproducens palmae TaxID=1770053 RepID=UPI0014813FAE|nr:hypothetical protein [Chitinasiproducens palmae]